MEFEPVVGDELVIDSISYQFVPHAAAPKLPIGQAGQQAFVYQLLAADGGKHALKVFREQYRQPSLVTRAEKLSSYATLPGLRVCRRTILNARHHVTLLQQHPDLTYAVLMPWIEGQTWAEVVSRKQFLNTTQSLRLASAVATALTCMEEQELAHCDLSGPNVMVVGIDCTAGDNASLIQFVDIEQFYGPDLVQPEVLPGSSPGYTHHKSVPHGWNLRGDRFAGAVLLAEMLGWCDSRVRDAAHGESYFDPTSLQIETERYHLLGTILHELWGERIATLFTRAWRSEKLNECPTFGEWLISLPAAAPELTVSPPAEDARHAGIVHATIQNVEREAQQGRPSSLDNIAPRDEEAAELFLAGFSAYQDNRWLEAHELFSEVVHRDPGYTSRGHSAENLLADVQNKLQGQKYSQHFWIIAGVLLVLFLGGGGTFRALGLWPRPSEPPTSAAMFLETFTPTSTSPPVIGSLLTTTSPPTSTTVPTLAATPLPAPTTTSTATAINPQVPEPTVTLAPTLVPAPQIVFVSDRDGDNEIYLMNIGDSQVSQLTHNTFKDEGPSWSGDGSAIVFHSDRVGYNQLYMMAADGSEQARFLTSSTIDEWPIWSPDGNQIAFSRIVDDHSEIHVANPDGSGVTRLTHTTGSTRGYSHACWPSGWSPDSNNILYYCYLDGYDQLWMMNRDGSNQHKLTGDANWNAIPTMSPDGSQIAFASFRNGNHEIYMMEVDSGIQTRLTQSADEDWRPGWSEDGSKVIFESHRSGRRQIYWMNLDGSEQVRLTDNTADDQQPAWRPLP